MKDRGAVAGRLGTGGMNVPRLMRGLAVALSAWVLLFGQPAWASTLAGARLVVQNALIFTMADGQQAPFVGHLVVGHDGRILEVGAGAGANLAPEARHVDAAGMWMLPGFVSAHSHLWQSAFAGIAPDQNLEGWIDQLYGQEAPRLSAGDLYALTMRGGLHHIRHGVTTVFNLTFTGADKSGTVDRCQLRGALDAGVRVVHGFNIRRISDQWSVDDARARTAQFLQWAAGQPERERYLGTAIAGAGAYYDAPEQARAEALFMREFGLMNQQHYLESPTGSAAERARYASLQRAGMVGPSLIFGHFIHTTPEILADAVRAGASMTWNPLSNGRLGSGTADVVRYREQGLRIGMGLDGEASADRADPFANMRAGLYQIRAMYRSAAVLSPYDVLRMHTVGSAEVLHLQDRIGSLAVGKYADFLLLDPSEFTPYKEPYAALVFAAGVEQIRAVYVGGQPATMPASRTDMLLPQAQGRVAC